ncbi:MAG: amidohydrolase family protein, partial [Actinobacteria bacterium]|nr:amidohydrolase family protein [Actinomycetota bacterium]
NEKDLKIFNQEFNNFLPKKIMDFHVHLWKKDFLNKEISEERQKSNPFTDQDIIDGFVFKDFKTISNTLFPDKEYSGLFFGLPVKEVDLDKANKYISDVCIENNCYGLYIPEPDLNEIPENFFKNRFVGFKPYPDLVDFETPADFSKLDIDVSMFDFISKKVLEFSNEYGLILLIHIPRKGRLSNKRNIEELRKIGEKYKNIKIILAHAGRSYCYEDIWSGIQYIKDMKNLYVDTAMINNFSVNKLLMEELGPERILYGSDLAVAALKGKNIDINNKHYFVTNTPKYWSLSSSEMNLDDFTFFIYEIIRAIKIATQSLNLIREDIEGIFNSNAEKLIESIIENKMYQLKNGKNL